MNVTRFSCLVAVSAAITVKLLTLRRVSEVSGRSARWLICALSIVFMFSGAQILFLKASLYQEVCLWAGMLGSLFVYFAIRGLVAGQFSRGNLCGMAVAAGLALHTRVSVAVGLYAALGLLIMLLTTRCLLRPAWNQASSEPPTDPASPSRTIFADLLPPLAILLTFAALAAFINVQRWGQPFMFANYDLYLMNESFPDRTARLDAYGLFNLVRLPLGVSYYFFPIWAARRADGNLFFEEEQNRLLDGAELPPSSFLVTDILLVGLLSFTFWVLARPRFQSPFDRSQLIAIGSGLALPWLLMMSAMYMSHRYRIDFYPLIEFGAFVSIPILSAAGLSLVLKKMVAVSVVLSILASHVVLLLYMLSPLGPPTDLLRRGVAQFYAGRIAEVPKLRWLMPVM